MVTSWTRGVAGQRASSSRRSRAVVDLPTATDPATPMTNGVPPTSSRRNVLEAACSPRVASMCRSSRREMGR